MGAFKDWVMDQQEQQARAAHVAEQRADMVQDIAETLSDTNDVDVTFERFARAVVVMLEERGVLRFQP